MSNIALTFPDGAVKEFAVGTTAEEVAASISPGLRKKAFAAKLNGHAIDYRRPIEEDGTIELIMPDSEEGLDLIRHSSAHLMAQAIKRLYPDETIHLGIGPTIENGFYYDIDMERRLTEEDLPEIEKMMNKIAGENLPIEREVVSRDEALAIYKELNDPLKVELIESIPADQDLTIYRQGEFFDLCRGPHVPATAKLQVFKLMSIAGAYWRGDSKNKMLQRIYGTAWATKDQLKQHLHFLAEAKERDHRKLGKELGLFFTSQEVGQGLRCGYQKEQRSVGQSSVISSIKNSNLDMSTSIHRSSVQSIYTRHRVTGITIKMTCSRKWRWTMKNSFFVR